MGAGSFPHVGFDVTRVYTALGPSTTAASVGVGNQAPQLGEVFHDEATGAIYKFVKNTHTVAFSVGDAGFWDFSGGLNTSVKKCVTGVLNVMAGIWVGAPATLGYGWIQTRGATPTVNIEGTVNIVLGDSLKGVNTQFYLVHDQAVGTVATYPNAHVIATTGYTAGAGTGVISGDIRCA